MMAEEGEISLYHGLSGSGRNNRIFFEDFISYAHPSSRHLPEILRFMRRGKSGGEKNWQGREERGARSELHITALCRGQLRLS